MSAENVIADLAVKPEFDTAADSAAVPTQAEVMLLVRQYALARITQNASKVERLAREISDALARAGLK